jgi:hypothetical protein
MLIKTLRTETAASMSTARLVVRALETRKESLSPERERWKGDVPAVW